MVTVACISSGSQWICASLVLNLGKARMIATQQISISPKHKPNIFQFILFLNQTKTSKEPLAGEEWFGIRRILIIEPLLIHIYIYLYIEKHPHQLFTTMWFLPGFSRHFQGLLAPPQSGASKKVAMCEFGVNIWMLKPTCLMGKVERNHHEWWVHPQFLVGTFPEVWN